MPPAAPKGRARGCGCVVVDAVLVWKGLAGEHLAAIDTRGDYPTCRLLREVRLLAAAQRSTDISGHLVLPDGNGRLLSSDDTVSTEDAFVIRTLGGQFRGD